MKKKFLVMILFVVMLTALLVPVLAISADGAPTMKISLGTPTVVDRYDGYAGFDVIKVPVLVSDNTGELYALRYQVVSDGLIPHYDEENYDEGYDEGDFTTKYGSKVCSFCTTINDGAEVDGKKGFQVVQDAVGGPAGRGVSAAEGTLITVCFKVPENPGEYTIEVIWMDGADNTTAKYEVTVGDPVKYMLCQEHNFTLNSNHTCDFCKFSKTPEKPVVESKNQNSVTLVAMEGFEYSKNGTTWQNSNVFTNLNAGTTYTFYQRVKASSVAMVSSKSPALTVKTDSLYTVVFKNWDGTVLSTKTYLYGAEVVIPDTPTRNASNTYTYTFAGWDKEVVNCEGNTTYTATYTSKYIDYTVEFKNWDGSLLSSDTYHYGDKVLPPSNPTRSSDNVYTYTFVGWDKSVTNCAGNTTYTAIYNSNYIDYTVEFENWDGSLLSSDTYHYGDKVLPYSNPTRGSDNVYTYTFAGWDKEVANCEGNATYIATYTSTYIDYLVVFRDWDETVLSVKSYHYGDDMTAPTNYKKTADNIYTYEFAGWDSKADKCTGNAIYTATYTPIYIDYAIVFKNWDSTVLSSGIYHYGDEVKLPETPGKASDNIYAYTFAGWDKEVVNCEGNATYTAIYTPSYVEYFVAFKNWDGSVISADIYHYGDEVKLPETPGKASDNIYAYTFAGWDKEVVNCDGNAIYKAIYTSSYVEYAIVFKNWDGTVLSSGIYHYGDEVTVPADPTRELEDGFVYIFAGWDKEVVDCEGDVVYTAVYEIVYTIGDCNGDFKVDTADLAILKLFLADINDLSDYGKLSADLNGDGVINTSDLAKLKLGLAGINSCELFGHNWIEATCQSPKTCSICKITEGDIAEHVIENGVCKFCGKKEKISSLSWGIIEETDFGYRYTLLDFKNNIFGNCIGETEYMDDASEYFIFDGITYGVTGAEAWIPPNSGYLLIDDVGYEDDEYLSYHPYGIDNTGTGYIKFQRISQTELKIIENAVMGEFNNYKVGMILKLVTIEIP